MRQTRTKTFPLKKIILPVLIALCFFSCKKDNTAPPAPIDPVEDYSKNQFEQNGVSLTWESNNAAFDLNIKKKLVSTFFRVYPAIYTYFNPTVRKSVTFRIDTQYNGVAYADFKTGVVVFSSAYMTANPNDADVVTHEVTHIVQAYPKYDPVWLVEGLADYSRYKFGADNPGANWALPDVTPAQKYTDSYRVTARFLVWIDVKVKDGTVKALDAALRTGTYTEATWKALTGKTVQELYAQYKQNPSIS